MSRRNRTERSLLITFAAFAALVPGGASAQPAANHPVGDAVPCAILESFDGSAQILDDTRRNLVDVSERKGIPCGGWISTDKGWVILKHRMGHQIHIGPFSFAQLSESSDGSGRDPVVLYKGEAFARADGGMGELSIATPNGRVRVTRGSVVVLFDQTGERSQLTVADGTADFENRFEPSRKVTVKAGQASQLDFQLMRVIPSAPKGVAAASLKAKLAGLKVSSREQKSALAAARRQSESKFVSAAQAEKSGKTESKTLARQPSEELKPRRSRAGAAQPPEEPAEDAPKGSKKELAQAESTEARGSRTPASGAQASSAQAQALRQHLVRRTVGGMTDGERILFPDKFYGKTQKSQVIVREPAAKKAKADQVSTPEDVEKRKLIEELSAIQGD